MPMVLATASERIPTASTMHLSHTIDVGSKLGPHVLSHHRKERALFYSLGWAVGAVISRKCALSGLLKRADNGTFLKHPHKVYAFKYNLGHYHNQIIM